MRVGGGGNTGKDTWAGCLKRCSILCPLPTRTPPPPQTDGERLPLAVKDLGSSDLYPQSLQHSPNGRFVTVCGDGEYVIYTALAWRNKSFGAALEFVWGDDSNVFATRESSSTSAWRWQGGGGGAGDSGLAGVALEACASMGGGGERGGAVEMKGARDTCHSPRRHAGPPALLCRRCCSQDPPWLQGGSDHQDRVCGGGHLWRAAAGRACSGLCRLLRLEHREGERGCGV